jgi:spore germination cell wall hydrolase CwlJ-like protein
MTLHLCEPDVPQRSALQRAIPLVLALFALGLLTAGLFANVNEARDLRRAQQIARAANAAAQEPVAPPNIVKPLTPEEALKANAERPFDSTPDTPAKQFRLNTDDGSRGRAVECLAQAVYYEAATEGVDGERAVAQVVLNRMRHPGFPPTVCGVVYQGSNLPTGCQFTFTCDGSLARTPIPSLWAQAKRVATEALNGHVFAPVGHATHYHANYVLPYWADSLAKQVQIGRHIFYRLEGALGTQAAFSQRYAGKEPLPPTPPSTAEVAADAAEQAQALLNSGLAAPPALAADAAGFAGGSDQPKPLLLADSSKGALLIDQGTSSTVVPEAPKRRRTQDECAGTSGKQIRPAAPADLHAGSASGVC